MRLTFHGGAREVTGALYLLQSENTNILIDCGIVQGAGETDAERDTFPFRPSEIDALIVTHAHLDHVGRIPLLVRQGFSGAIFSTAPTRDLAELILEDALALAHRQGKEPYQDEDIKRALTLWKPLHYHEKQDIKNVSFHLRNAGHILGSSMPELLTEGKHFLFTGDLGNVPSSLMSPPEQITDMEYLVIESTYGNRVHESPEERDLKLERAVEDIAASGGTLMIPAFATERTQDILFTLNEMLHHKRIPEIPVFVDAPLAIRVTKVFETYIEFYRDEIKQLYIKHPHLFSFKNLRFTEAVEDSKHINSVSGPKVIIAGSGMMTGGRILHHARRYLSDPKSILLITGYQSAGSLGRRLIDGLTMVKLFGEDIPVRAEVRKIGGFSAHADSPQLLSFVDQSRETLKQVFVVQGEEAQTMPFVGEIRDRLGIPAVAPVPHESFEF